jgi:hypothetical protein
MKARAFDTKFESGEDITDYLDLKGARRPGHEQKRVNVDFPIWMIQSLDKEADRLGVPRQSLIKVLVAEHLDRQG